MLKTTYRHRVHLREELSPATPDASAATGREAQPEAEERPSESRPPSPERLQSYLDQVLLRVFVASPGLASYIESSRVVPAEGHVELSFYKVPDEVISAIHQAFGIPAEEMRYTKDGAACIGFRAKPTREDLSALGVDDGDQEAVRDTDPEEEAEGAGLTAVGVEANELLQEPP